jgi:hypothetical protein
MIQKAPKPMTMDMTENEVRRHYRDAGWSDADIDERLRQLRETAQQTLT